MFGHLQPAGVTCVLALGFVSTAHAETCEATPFAIRVAIEDAMQAYALWDWQRMTSTLERVRRDRACTAGVLSPGDVLRLHLLEAAARGHAADLEGAVAAMRGVLAIDPSYQPGEDFAAPGSLLHDAFQMARGVGDEPTLLLPPGLWSVNGRVGATTLPLARAVLVQRIDLSTGLTVANLYLTGLEDDEATLIAGLLQPEASQLEPPPPEEVPVMRPGSRWRDSQRRPESRLDRNTEIGLDIGFPTGLRLGVHPERWNRDGGFGVDGFGIQAGFPTPPFAAVYLDLNLNQSWQLELTGEGFLLGIVNGGGGGIAAQWDPPGRSIHAQVGIHAGAYISCFPFLGCNGPHPYPAPDLRVGWTF